MNFEEWYLDNRKDAARDVLLDAFEAGAQSQQAKIDELQARIDDFIQYLRDNHFEIPEKTIEYFEDILKGNKDEN